MYYHILHFVLCISNPYCLCILSKSLFLLEARIAHKAIVIASKQTVLLNSTQYFFSTDPAIDLCPVRSIPASLSFSFHFLSF